MYFPPPASRPSLISLAPLFGVADWLPVPSFALSQRGRGGFAGRVTRVRFRRKTPSHAARRRSSPPSPSKSTTWRLWIVWSESSTTSDGQDDPVGSSGTV